MISAIPVLSSCAVLDVLGPRPNAELLGLAQQAVTDQSGHADDVPEFAQLRGEQAEALLVEISRLCGTDETGALPETCVVEPAELRDTELAPAGGAGESLERTLTSLPEVPEESVDLLTTHAIELATADQDTSLPQPPAVADEDDLETARELLTRSYAAEYGLGVAVAFLSPENRPLYDSVLTGIQERILSLQLLLEPTGDVPVAEPGYEFTTGPDPAAGMAAEFVRSVAAAEELRWQVAASEAESAEWRSFTVDAAAHAGAARSAAG